MQTEQNERYHKNSSMSISFKKHHELSFKQFWSIFTQNNSSSSISVKNKSAWQIDNLISILVNENNLHMNLLHVQMISDWCNHSSKIFYDIQIFIEFCNFYQQFIFNFADIAWFLHSLLHDMKKDKKSDLIADEW